MFVLGIAGGSGSGKTTFAHKVIDRVPSEQISIVHMDSYYLNQLPTEIITTDGKANYDHPRAFDWELLRTHLTQLKNNQSIEMPKYNFKSHSRHKETITIHPKSILIFEGIFALFDPEIRKLLDVKCFLNVDSDIRFTRRLHRDIQERGRDLDSVIDQYYATVRPMYQKFLDPQKQYADVTIGEETDQAAIIISSRLKEIILEKNKEASTSSLKTDALSSKSEIESNY